MWGSLVWVLSSISFLFIVFWERGFVISNNPFTNLALHVCLHMSCIDISLNIMSPSREHKNDNVTYTLCVLTGTSSSVKSMIKCSNVYSWILNFMTQKARTNGNWYLLMLNVLKVFDSWMWRWYYEFYMGTIGIKFFCWPCWVISCKVLCFLMNSFKSKKSFVRKCIEWPCWIHWDWWQ
jgi:hypothetical protein